MVGTILTFVLAADLFVPVAGNTPSASGREFRTSVWITNLAARPVSVRVTFLERHPVQAASSPVTIALDANETKEIDDLPLRLGRVGVVGALRFESPERLAVAARIFSGPAIGEGLAGIDIEAGLKHGEEGVIPGVQYTDDSRQTTYLVEMSGRPAGVFVSLRDAKGRPIAHEGFLLEAYEHRALAVSEIARSTQVSNGSLSVRVTGGSGRVYAIGFQIPQRNGDGYFVEMTTRHAETAGASPLEIAMYSLTALAVLAAVSFDIYRRKSAKRA